MKKLELDSLSLELTRRCNMRCAHCLRGKAQNKDVSPAVIESVFAGISAISTLTFSGGEPSLAYRLMAVALNAAKRYGVRVSQVHIVTNAKKVTEQFLSVCREWHMYCLSCNMRMSPEMDYREIYRFQRMLSPDECIGTYIAISMDRFHEPVRCSNILALNTLPNVTIDKYNDGTDDDWVLQEGRALTNVPGGRDIRKERPWMFEEGAKVLDAEETEGCIYVDELYVNAEGGILKYCDYSYRDQQDWTIGCVMPADGAIDTEWPVRLIKGQETGGRENG